jgi:hypothetical protein
MMIWVAAANASAKTTYAVTGSGVFQPGAVSGPAGQVATPIITPQTGTYSTGQNITIACATSGATIYYTTNGSDPTTSSAAYSAPISVSSTTTIKALAAKSGMTNSNIASSILTFPAAQPGNITQIKFFPMAGLESRSNGGAFDVSNDRQNWTTIYTIPATPSAGWSTVAVTTSQVWRYIRFRSSASQYAAMSEIEYYNGAVKLSGGVISSPFSDNYPPAAAFDGATGLSWKSAEWRGWARSGGSWRGEAGAAWTGRARRGKAKSGAAGVEGVVRRGRDGNGVAGAAWRGLDVEGQARRGRQGTARHGADGRGRAGNAGQAGLG